MTLPISRATFDLIVESEVSSRAVYERKYRRPEWPGESSGVTVMIGYDVGYATVETLRRDLGGRIPSDMLKALESACGVTGPRAKPLAQRLRAVVDISWDVAIAVFTEVDLPKWVDSVRRSLPNTELLSPDCLGVLVSLAYNRGPSFGKLGDRYREMRAIRAHMGAKNFDLIPAELRAMKRLWPNSRGLRIRRDKEAALFEKGLAAIAPARFADLGGGAGDGDAVRARPDATGDDRTADPPADAPAEVAPHSAPEIEAVQRRLKALGYAEVGSFDGAHGSRTTAALAAFEHDRGLTVDGEIDDAVLAELAAAEREGWVRPIAPERAEGVPEGSRIVAGAEKQGAVGTGTAVVGGGGFLAWLMSWFDSGREALESVGPVVAPYVDLIRRYWWLLALLAAAVVLWQAVKIRHARIEDHRTGRTT